MTFDIVVLGGGINGLCTAYHLNRLSSRKVALLDQFSLQHTRGSSHGKSRITRSSYNSAKYVELIQIAHAEEWPRLIRDSGQQLLVPTPGCFHGPGVEPYIESLTAVPDLRDRIRVLTPDQARKRFPMFRFPDSPRVLEDSTCSVVAAEKTMTFLAQKAATSATLLENCRVNTVESEEEHLRLQTSQGDIFCERLVVTAGSWLPTVFPEFAPKLKIAHQDVGYFQIAGCEGFPVWVYCADREDHFYGLPSFGRPGAKVARHRTTSQERPGGKAPERMPAEAARDLERFMQAQFRESAELVGYEACIYTNTANEDYILDFHPRDSRILIGSACSGHGFKFGPLTGRLLAEMALEGKTTLPVFERLRDHFRWPAHQDWSS